ncbi:MAG: class I SAM-dependent methyltransferase [Armatimonadetes bacterium]|nr:class I SAM-dependent methyltransferase [Armatimonadota bacterium]
MLPHGDDESSLESQASHYYVSEPLVRSRPRQVNVRLRGLNFAITTDRGVFSYGEIDPGTAVLIKEIEIPEGGEVLDLGCGYGIIGIVVAMLQPSCRVTMVDTNLRACRLALENARSLGLRNVEVVAGDARYVLAGRRFNAIFTNPPIRAGRDLVLSLFGWAASALMPDGVLWTVIHTNKGARRYHRDLGQWFRNVEVVRIKAGYRVFRCSEPIRREQQE